MKIPAVQPGEDSNTTMEEECAQALGAMGAPAKGTQRAWTSIELDDIEKAQLGQYRDR